jgi:hypothetical protein
MPNDTTGNEPQGRPVEVPQKAGGSASKHSEGDCGADAEVSASSGSQSAWMLISRSLPERGQRVLAFGINLFKKNHDVYEAELCGDGQWRTPAEHPSSPGDNVELEDVTHWMPMPKAPNDAGCDRGAWLGLPSRTRNALAAAGITEFAALDKMSESDMLRIAGLGRIGLKCIHEEMARRGIWMPRVINHKLSAAGKKWWREAKSGKRHLPVHKRGSKSPN